MSKEEIKDRIVRAEEIQRYTENRCETLEQENRLLSGCCNQFLKDKGDLTDQLAKAKDLIKRLMHELVVSNRPYNEVELLVKDVEQFLRETDIGNAIQKANEELEKLSKAKTQKLTKAKYTLEKIIETVQNDRIDEYGARLVLIKDFAYECLEEI